MQQTDIEVNMSQARASNTVATALQKKNNMHQVNSELVEELSAVGRDIGALEKKTELLINNRILTRERDDADTAKEAALARVVFLEGEITQKDTAFRTASTTITKRNEKIAELKSLVTALTVQE